MMSRAAQTHLAGCVFEIPALELVDSMERVSTKLSRERRVEDSF